ncbi:DUF262 domain-containing protein [Vibrio cyclitrophicus]|uniref:DUF262 domain-containing protein n=1 Tax=Vibrio cyclitrophicus TaxID=47951 RepID=UPI00399BEAF4
MDVKPNYCSLEQVFSENTLLKVPKYQRAYSWQKDNIDQFTADIEALFKSFQNGSTDENHFLGGVVCVRIPNKDVLDDKVVYQLVDGQQRLSTTVLLISRLIHFLKGMKLDEESSGIRERRVNKYKSKFLEFIAEENGKDVKFPRITLSRRDKDYYHNVVLNEIITESDLASHKLIKNAVSKIDAWFKVLFENDNEEEILRNSDILFRVISSALKILMIKMSDVNDAYRLFQVINDRGRSLTAGDLLRASSLGMYDNGERIDADLESLENIWDNITANGAASTDHKLIAYYNANVGKTVRKSALFEDFNKEFFQGSEDIKSQIDDLSNGVSLYKSLSKGKWPYSDSNLTGYQKKKLYNLVVVFKHTHCLPLLMSATALKEKKFYQLVFFLEKFFFLFKVALDKRMSPVTKLYNTTIDKVNDSPEKYQVKWFLDGLKEIVKDKVRASEIANYLDGLFYISDGDNRHIKYILSTVEENSHWLSGNSNHPVLMYKNAFKSLVDDSFVYTLEHLYPAKAKSDEIIPDMEELKNRLPNLALLYDQDNSRFKNNKFSVKKTEYLHSRLNTTIQLERLEDFTKDGVLSSS